MEGIFRTSNVPDRTKARFAGQPDHLTICFWMWALFNSVSDEDYPALVKKWQDRLAQKGRVRRMAIVALTRQLLVALWRYIVKGEPIEGAIMNNPITEG